VKPSAAIARLRKTCLALPEATEKLSHAEPTWFAGPKGKVFVMLSNHHHDDASASGAQRRPVSRKPS
jgi:hypothetical protein